MFLVNLYNNEIEKAIYTKDIPLLKLEHTKKLNEPDSLYFEINKNNPGYDRIENLKTKVKVFDTDKNKYIFSGRVTDSIPKIKGGSFYKEVKCESALSFLKDIHSSKLNFNMSSSKEILYILLSEYNKKVENEKKIYLGNVDIIDKTTINTEGDTILSEIIKLPIILGGVLYVRDENNKFYLDYLKEYNQSGDLSIAFAEDIISFIKDYDTKEIATRIIPIDYNTKSKININDIKKLKYIEDIEKFPRDSEISYEKFKHLFRIKIVNSFIEYIEDITASKEYGIIEKIWSHPKINSPSSLIQSARVYLDAANQTNFSINIDKKNLTNIIKFIDKDFQLGDTIHIQNDKLKLNVRPLIIKSVADLLTEYNPVYTISTRQPLLFSNSYIANEVGITVSNETNSIDLSYIESKIDEVNGAIEIAETKIEQTNTYLEQHKDSIEMGVSTVILDETITSINGEISNVTKTIEDINTYLELNKDNIEMGMTTEDKTEITNYVDGKISEVNTDIVDINTYLSIHKDTIEQGVTQTQLQETITTVNQNVSYKVDIISTNGYIFKNDNVSTKLIARVYQGTSDVTDTIDASRFKWEKTNTDGTLDTAWNNSHFGGTKEVTVTGADINQRATFTCQILET